MNPREPKSASESTRRREEIARNAAEWVWRRLEGLTRTEQNDFERWLRIEEHAVVFAEMSETSELLDRLRDPVLASPREVSAAKGQSFAGNVNRRGAWFASTALAAAATVAILCAVWWRPVSSDTSYSSQVVTEIGGPRRFDLPDGSIVRMNTDSTMEVRYTKTERRVSLTRGEAHFTVAKNSARPFRVQAGTVSVRAVGTEFNVRYRPDTVEVLVTEGSVQVKDTPVASGAAENLPSLPLPASERLLVAGQRLTVALDPPSADISPVAPVVTAIAPEEIARKLAWRERRLEFDDVPLAQVVAEFNRYNKHQLDIGDPELRAVRVGGAFATHGYASFVEILEQSFDVVAERHPDRTILRKTP